MKSILSKVTLHPFLFGVFLSLVDAKGTYYGNPYRYNLYKSGVNPHYSPGKPMGRHKNYCAYVVQKNISCTMQDGVATYVKAEYSKCAWGQKCPAVMYRTFYKPKYKVGYKTVTELEWRCCPGYSGEGCFDGPTALPDMPPFKGGLPHPGFKGYPRGHPRGPEQKPIPGGRLDPTKSNYGQKFGGVTGERLDRIEEDVRRLSKGLDTLNGAVTGLEERLRQGMREDTNKMLTTLLGTAPRTSDSTVGFGVIPDGTPDGLEGGEGFPGFGDLAGRVTEVKDEIRAKSDMLDEIHGMVLGHDGQLKQLLEAAAGRPVSGDTQKLLEELLDAKLAGVRAEILDGFERRLTGMQSHCDERIGQVQQQCHQDQLNGQEQMETSLDGRETGLRKELGDLQAQIQGLTLTESCCTQVSSLAQRMLLLEDSVKGLTESQRQLQLAHSDQTIHVETMIEGRLEYIEGRINTTERVHTEDGGRGPADGLDGWKTLLDDKLKTLEDRLFMAVEELSNVTAPALLEGQAVPALETEIEAVRQRVEEGLDGVQKQLTDLELLCTSACSPTMDGQVDTGEKKEEEEDHCGTMEGKLTGRLDGHSDRLDRLNGTLGEVLARLAQEEEEGSIQGEITLLKVNINSVNRTLKGLRESVGTFTREVGHVNASWQQREDRLASQVQGITQLVGRQVSQLGSSERRLIQLKGELQSLRRRLAGELQGCRSTALGVQREVMAVDSRVKQVEGRCSSLGDLADHLERIRGELEQHSDGYLLQVNSTLASHSQQLSELKDGLKDCAAKTGQAGPKGAQ
ncbi:EMILIN-3 isoform X1 [Anguilla anguilla]|uniref:EMILIN-3 isoform X1 n=2 Tax=Anguilla anguilla TaxID=7936 RepID=UPI0015AF55C6|nr:EMILIN-3 isoform X1 [Anguilla anguilla]XP_035236811.1 EMILIN-3 isoform X1 [Anguilla anguilla]XP_035236812.1 EMILIN-3 isoform X1 [Anguilla anguilla]